MLEVTGDLWALHAAGAVVAITTNGLVSKAGKAVMLRGCARQARGLFPRLPRTLGVLIRQHGNHVFDLGQRIVSFPVEDDPYRVPDLQLIERSCAELVELCDDRRWRQVFVPRPGCGHGGLEWAEVRSVLERYFDDRFHVICREGLSNATGQSR
jgi:hypothetical protein